MSLTMPRWSAARVALQTFEIATEWPFDPTRLPRVATDETERLDLTALPLVTIDGESARDFDDAVFAERRSRDAKQKEDEAEHRRSVEDAAKRLRFD